MAAKPEEEWREALIKAKPGLIEYLEVDDWFLAKLCADEIIDQNTSKTIKAITSPQERNGKLVDILLKKDRNQFDDFCKYLEETCQNGAFNCINDILVAGKQLHGKEGWWLEEVYGKANAKEKKEISKFIEKQGIITLAGIAAVSDIADMSLGDSAKKEFRKLREICRGGGPITITPWSKPIKMQWQIDLPSCISEVKIIQKTTPARTGITMTVQPLPLDIAQMCRTFKIDERMAIDLVSTKAKPWCEEEHVMCSILQNREGIQDPRNNLIIIERISEISGKKDEDKAVQESIETPTHSVDRITKGRRKFFTLHLKPSKSEDIKSSDVDNSGDGYVECQYYARNLETLLKLPVFKEWSQGKGEISSFPDKDDTIKSMVITDVIRRSFEKEQDEVLQLELSLLKPSGMKEEYDASERFIKYHQQLNSIDLEHKEVMNTTIGKCIAEELSEAYDDKIGRILPDFEHICTQNKFVRSEKAIREIVSEFEGKKVANFIENYPSELKEASGMFGKDIWFFNKGDFRVSMEDCKKISDEINVVVLGKPCSGKSWTCNTLIGQKYFEIRSGPKVVTQRPKKYEFKFEDMKINVIDTPPLLGDEHKEGYSDSLKNPSKAKDVINEIMNMCDKKVHVFLHIQSGGGVRFTDEERRVLETVQTSLGADALNNVAFVINRGEEILRDKNSVSELMETNGDQEEANVAFYREAITAANGRLLMIENTYESRYLRETQQENLLQLIWMTVRDSEGKPLTSKEYERIRDEEISKLEKKEQTYKALYPKLDKFIVELFNAGERDKLTLKNVVDSMGGVDRCVEHTRARVKRKYERMDASVTREEKDIMEGIKDDPSLLKRLLEHYHNLDQSTDSNDDIKDDMRKEIDGMIVELAGRIKHHGMVNMKHKVEKHKTMWTKELLVKWNQPQDTVRKLVDERAEAYIELYKDAICFPSNSTIQTTKGRTLMKYLQIGDMVKTANRKGDLSYEPIVYFSHKMANSGAPYLIITTDSTERLSISARHLMHVNAIGALMAAANIKVGDTVYTIGESDGTLTPRKVISISEKMMDGVYCPHTASGNIVVDNMLTSCYTTVLHNSVAHLLLQPLVLLYKVLPTRVYLWLVQCDENNGYPPLLQNLVCFEAGLRKMMV